MLEIQGDVIFLQKMFNKKLKKLNKNSTVHV